jgi:type I restriction enzyme R subunit
MGSSIPAARPRCAASKFADYVLYHQNVPLAVVEAKDNNHSLGGGMQQALDYADMLDAPFAYSSNGDGFLQHVCLAHDGSIYTIMDFRSVTRLFYALAFNGEPVQIYEPGEDDPAVSPEDAPRRWSRRRRSASGCSRRC